MNKDQPSASSPSIEEAEIHFKNAWQHRKHKRYREAVEEFRKSLGHQPNHGATHFNLGWVYDRLGEGEQALVHVRKSLDLFEAGKQASNADSARGLLSKLLKKYSDQA